MAVRDSCFVLSHSDWELRRRILGPAKESPFRGGKRLTRNVVSSIEGYRASAIGRATVSTPIEETVAQPVEESPGASVDNMVMERPETTVVESTVGGSFIAGPGVDPAALAHEVDLVLSRWILPRQAKEG